MAELLHVALKSLLARKFRLVTTSIAVVLGVAFMAGTLVLTSTMNQSFNDMFSSAFKGTDTVVRGPKAFSSENGSQAERLPIDASLLEVIKRVPGVAAAEPDITGATQIIDKKGKPLGGGGAPNFGANWNPDTRSNPFKIFSGTAPVNADDVVIDLASSKKTGYKAGDTIPLLAAGVPTQAHVSGVAKFGSADSPLGATYVLFTLDTAQKLIGQAGKYDDIGVRGDGISQETLRTRVSVAVPQGLDVVTGATVTKENQQTFKQILDILGKVLLVFAGISLFVGIFIIYNTFSILVAQRTKETALLRAIGATRRQVTSSVMIESLAVGVIAGALGLLAGIGVALLLQLLLSAVGAGLPDTATVVPGSAIFLSFLVGIIVSVVSAYIPARRASRVPPVAAMRDVAIDTTGSSKLRVVLGLLILAAGVGAICVGLFAGVPKPYIPVGVGVPITFLGVAALGPTISGPIIRVLGLPLLRLKGTTGRLARENAMRNPKRTSSTAAALMIGVGLVGFIVILTASLKASITDTIDKTISADFVVQATGQLDEGLSPQAAIDLSKLPQVRTAVGITAGPVELNGHTTELEGSNVAELATLVDPQVRDGSLKNLGPTDIAVSAKMFDDQKWTLGQDLPIRFADTGAKTFRIAATYKNADAIGSTYLVDSAAFNANFNKHLDVVVLVSKAQGAAAADTRDAIEKVMTAYPNSKVQDQTEFKQSITSQLDQVLAIILVLLALAVIVALIGIANTLVLSVYERTQEIGLLRAVGMTRRQVRSFIRWEAVLVALFGTVLGLVVAIFFGTALVTALHDQGINELSIPVGRLALIAIVAAVSGVAAAIWPAWRASRLNVLRAIAST